MKSKKQSVKRFLHNNAVTLGAVLLLAVVLGVFVVARYDSLYSIRNIANINPLITSGSAELVAVNVNGVVKIIKDGDSSTITDNDASTDESKSVTPNKTVIGSNSGGSTGSSSGSSGASVRPSPSSLPSTVPSPSSSPSPSRTPSPFTATIASLGPATRRVYDVKGGLFGLAVTCKNDHTVPVKVQITGGSGSVKVQWRFNGNVNESSLGTVLSGDVKTVEVIVMTDRSVMGGYSLTVDVINGDNSVKMTSKSINLGHSC